MSLEAMSSPVWIGVTNNDSSVPRSHSRAITSDVSSAPFKVMMRTIEPGNQEVSAGVRFVEPQARFQFTAGAATRASCAGGARLMLHCAIAPRAKPRSTRARFASTPLTST